MVQHEDTSAGWTTPVDYDSEEEREQSAWDWDVPDHVPDDQALGGRLLAKGGSSDIQSSSEARTDLERKCYSIPKLSEALSSEQTVGEAEYGKGKRVNGDLEEGRQSGPSGYGNLDPRVVIVEGYHPFGLEDNAPVLVQAVPSRGLSFQLWPAAEALCHYLNISYGASKRLQGLRVLELGAGTGLVGIFAARLGADVMLTDLPAVLDNLRANVVLNHAERALVKDANRSSKQAINVAVSQSVSEAGNGVSEPVSETVSQSFGEACNRVSEPLSESVCEAFNGLCTTVSQSVSEAPNGVNEAVSETVSEVYRQAINGVSHAERSGNWDKTNWGKGAAKVEAVRIKPAESGLGIEEGGGSYSRCTQGTEVGAVNLGVNPAENGVSVAERCCDCSGVIRGSGGTGFKVHNPVVNAVVSGLRSFKKEHESEVEMTGRLEVRALSWRKEEDVEALLALGGGFDLVLASDVVYYDTLFEPLLQTLRWLSEQQDRGKALPDVNDLAGSSGKSSPNGRALRAGDTTSTSGAVVTKEGSQALAGGRRCSRPTILIAHLRRWKKDAKFFRKASRYFDVRLVYTHPPINGARKGVEVYKLKAL